ncbi:MAG: chromosomal replication initiator protein DnaA [Alphaproteobacteria bacterium]|nr:chromosomal replication initiator protein DnaA [Alphaproteobacteria bacterium]
MTASAQVKAESLETVWDRVKAHLRAEFGDAAFRSWLKPLTVSSLRGGQVMITAPTRFMREWVVTHYIDALKRYWNLEEPSVQSVDVFVKPTAQPQLVTLAGQQEQASGLVTESVFEAKAAPIVTAAPDVLEQLSASLDPRFTFDTFVVGKPNELAYAAARRVAESPVVSPGCNPLFIYGGVGLGKTHLMHAIAHHIRTTNPARKVIYLSAEKFMYQFIRALRMKDTMAFKEQFRSVDVLMIDDVQFIAGKDSTQEEFFHTFNALVDQKSQLVISGDRSPSDLEGIEERVKSRLGWGLVADVHATTYELRLGILQSKIEQMQNNGANPDVPQKVLEFLAHKITSNVRELEGALNRVLAHASLVGREVTIETTQEFLRDLLRSNERKVTVEDIQKKVAEHYNLKVSDMHSARRSRTVARPRQVAMYLSKKFTTKSLPEIGRKFGGKDHTTVMHAVKKVEELCLSDAEFREDVELLSKMIAG